MYDYIIRLAGLQCKILQIELSYTVKGGIEIGLHRKNKTITEKGTIFPDRT